MEPTNSKILSAIRQGQYKQLELYLRHDYDIHVTTKDGRNGLFFAMDIEEGRKRRRMIRFCLDHGIDPLQRENLYGFSPLNEAVARQQIDSIQLFLANAGGEINWREFDKRGRTILHQAVEINNPTIVEALIQVTHHYGVSVDINDSNGLTPYLLAKKLHLPEIEQILVERGRASRQQCDLVNHRSAEDWQQIGLEERRSFIRSQIIHEIDTAKKNGKINRVKKLQRVFNSPILSAKLLAKSTSSRRNSFQSEFTSSSVNIKPVIAIRDMIERLPDGEIPQNFAQTEPDSQTFQFDSTKSSFPTIPTLTTARQPHEPLSLNALVDLFQVVTEQLSPSFRASIPKETNVRLNRAARKKNSQKAAGSSEHHRSTLASLKNPTKKDSRKRNPSHGAVPIK